MQTSIIMQINPAAISVTHPAYHLTKKDIESIGEKNES